MCTSLVLFIAKTMSVALALFGVCIVCIAVVVGRTSHVGIVHHLCNKHSLSRVGSMRIMRKASSCKAGIAVVLISLVASVSVVVLVSSAVLVVCDVCVECVPLLYQCYQKL